MKENEKDLQCYMKHESPVLMANLSPKIQSNQRLLCEKCLQYYESDGKLIGIKKIIQMIEEKKKKSLDILEYLIKINIKNVQSIQTHIQKLKSYVVQQLDQILYNTKEWTTNLESISQKYSKFSFFQELDYIIDNQQSYIQDQDKISNQIKILNDSWNTKISPKLEIFKSFNEFQLCEEILKNLSDQSTQDQIIQQIPNQNIKSNQSIENQQVIFYSQQQTPPKVQEQQYIPKKGGLFGFISKQ